MVCSPTAVLDVGLISSIAVYLVGQHPNSPQNPHSGLASGGSDILHIRTSPATEAHVLYGALVGGPLANDRFWDWRDDWAQTEIALDYNAMIPTIAAMQVCRLDHPPRCIWNGKVVKLIEVAVAGQQHS
jgi:hypothetical protein